MDPVGLDPDPGSDWSTSVPTHPWPVPWEGWGRDVGLGHTALELQPHGVADPCRALTEIYCLFHEKKKEIASCKEEDNQRTD